MEPCRNRVYKTWNLHTITQNTKPQHFQTTYYKIRESSNTETPTPFHSAFSNSFLNSLTHSLSSNRSPPSRRFSLLSNCSSLCQRYSLSLLNTLSFLLLRFLCLCLSLSPILDFGISWCDLGFFVFQFRIFLGFFFFWLLLVFWEYGYVLAMTLVFMWLLELKKKKN